MDYAFDAVDDTPASLAVLDKRCRKAGNSFGQGALACALGMLAKNGHIVEDGSTRHVTRWRRATDEERAARARVVVLEVTLEADRPIGDLLAIMQAIPYVKEVTTR